MYLLVSKSTYFIVIVIVIVIVIAIVIVTVGATDDIGIIIIK